MSTAESNVNETRADQKWLYRVGGISGLLLGLGYIVIIALYVPMGAPASGAEARLAQVAANPGAWWGIIGLSVLTDFLFVPLALALYFALKGINRPMMLLATICVALFVFLDLALTWTNYAVLLSLSGGYAAADEAQRAVYAAAALYPSAIIESTLLFIYNTMTLSLGILMTGLVMRKSLFNKVTAYTAILTGIFGIIAVVGPLVLSGLESTIILASLLTTAWVMLAGYRLFRLGRE